jgi:hypothetical protein
VPVRSIVAFVVLALVVTACSDDDGSSSSPDSPDPADSSAVTTASDTDDPGEAIAETTETSVGPSTTMAERPGSIASASVAGAPNSPMVAVVAVVLDVAAQVEATATSGDHVVDVPLTVASEAGERSIPVIGLRAGRTYDIEVRTVADGGVTDAATVAFDVPPLPDWMPDHSVTMFDAERVSEGYTIIETRPRTLPGTGPEDNNRFGLIAYDTEGEVVWYWMREVGEELTDLTLGVHGFEPTAAGSFLTHYWVHGILDTDFAGNVLGHWQPAPIHAQADELAYISGAEEGEPAVVPVEADWVELLTWHHENWPMPNGNILALSTTNHPLTPEQQQAVCPDDEFEFGAISDVIVEFSPDGTVLRTWDLWDAIDFDVHPGVHMCNQFGIFTSVDYRDWSHANSVVYDERRDAIIVSVRHTNQVIAFDHLDEMGPQSDVRWIIGAGSELPLDGDPPFHQHAAEVIDETGIIIYDNGNFRPGTGQDPPGNPPYSRAVIYDVDDTSADPADWTITQRWQHIAYHDDGRPIFTAFIGDADPLPNGNVLINHGGVGPFPPDDDSPLGAIVLEVVPEGDDGGDIVWQLVTDASEQFESYRAERIESFYFGPDWVS